MLLKIFGGIALVVSLSSLVACKGHHSRWHGKTPAEKTEKIMKMATKKLDLNQDQQGSLKILVSEFMAVKAQMHDGRNEMHGELLTMLQGDKIQQERLLEIVKYF